MDDHLPADVRSTIDEWLAVHDDTAPGVVEGLYLVGSAALDDWQPTSDIDVVAFVADPTDAAEAVLVEAAHRSFREVPGRPFVDGPFLSWADVTAPPVAVQRAWSLEGDFHVDGECFEINPVTWFTLATYGIAVRGPAAAELGVTTDVGDRRSWVRANVDTYWRHVLTQVEQALAADPARDEFDAAMQEWCALGIARMAYTFETGDVTSKSGAGAWLADRQPEYAGVLLAAIAHRRDPGDAVVGRSAVTDLVGLMGDAVERITGT